MGDTDGQTFYPGAPRSALGTGADAALPAGMGLAAYLPDSAIGVTGLPHWFEMACLLVPLLFIGLCWLMVRTVFRDISLEDRDAN